MPRTILTYTCEHDRGILTVRLTPPDADGYTEYDVILSNGWRYSDAEHFPCDDDFNPPTITVAMRHLLEKLSEDCDHDLTWYDHNSDSDLLLGNKDMARTIVEQGCGDLPHMMFVQFARDVVPAH